MCAEKKSVCIRMTSSRERGSNACKRASFDKETGHSCIDFLFRNFKTCPKLWAYFTLKFNWPTISDQTNMKKNPGSIDKCVRNGLMFGSYYHDNASKMEIKQICYRPVTINALP